MQPQQQPAPFPGSAYNGFPMGSRTADAPIFDGAEDTVDYSAAAADDSWGNGTDNVDGW